MPVLKNRAYVSTATTGTGTITLGSPVSGYQSFANAGVANGNSVRYTIEDGANFEIGTGTYTASGTTLSRTPSESSNSGSAINLSGSARVFITAAAEDILQPSNNLSDLSNASTSRTNLGVAIGSDVQAYSSVLQNTTASYTTALNTKLSGIETGADVTDAANVNPLVDSHINVSSASSGQYLNWNGSDYAWGSIDTSTLMPKTGGTFTGDVIYQGSNANIEFDVSNNAMEVKDNAKIIVGNGDDMMLYHNGTNYIDLYGNTYIRNTKANSYTFLEADNGSGSPTPYVTLNGVTGEVQLSHYGSQKLATKSTGIQTTGTVNVNGAYTLPTSDGSANQVLTTNGSGVVAFADAGGGAEAYTRDTKTANYTVVAGDLGKIIDVTSNSVTITMTSASTLGAGFYVYIRNSSTTNGHVVTVVGTSSQTINGSSNGRKLYRNEFIQLVCDGSNFYSLRSETPGLSTNLELPNSLGNEPDASGLNSICLGFESSATGVRSFTAGYQADATGDRATALGYSATASGAESPLAIGDSVASGSYAIAIGPDASASNTEDIAIGRNASATGSIGIALGHDTKTTGAAATSINVLNHTYGAKSTYSIAIGYFSTVNNTYGMALGPSSNCQGYAGIAIGNGAAVYNMGDGANYAVAFGRSVDVRAHNAFGLGHQTSIPTVRGKYAYSSGSIASTGDAQTGTFVLKSDTTDATAEALTTNNSTAAANNQITLPDNSAYAFHGTIVARQQAADGTACAAWKVEGLIRREANAGTTVLVNSATTVLDNTPNWGMALSADTTNGCLKIQVTGAASTDIRWVATIHTSEVTYA